MTPDLDALEAAARAAWPGPWEWWTSCSWRRMPGVLEPVVHADGQPSIQVRDCNMDFIAIANPATVLALIAMVRDARKAAIEEAARVCDDQVAASRAMGEPSGLAEICRNRIRALGGKDAP